MRSISTNILLKKIASSVKRFNVTTWNPYLPHLWPARSPDLDLIDYFLWGHLKSLVYNTPVKNVDIQEIGSLLGVVIRQLMRRRLDSYNLAGGSHFRIYLCCNEARLPLNPPLLLFDHVHLNNFRSIRNHELNEQVRSIHFSATKLCNNVGIL